MKGFAVQEKGSGLVKGLGKRLELMAARAQVYLATAPGRLARLRKDEEGQGTTEYAILVGVLVVIAIVAIAAFRGRLTELWNDIANGINGL